MTNDDWIKTIRKQWPQVRDAVEQHQDYYRAGGPPWHRCRVAIQGIHVVIVAKYSCDPKLVIAYCDVHRTASGWCCIAINWITS